MKSIKSYISSLILSVLLVFAVLGTSAAIAVKKYASPDALKELSIKNGVVQQIKSQLADYYSDRYNATGIPAETYTEAFTDEYIQQVVESYIDTGFECINGNKNIEFSVPVNSELQSNMNVVFEEYAESKNYEKDDFFYLKLDESMYAAYKKVGEYCDVYKLETMYNSNILEKVSKIYPYIDNLPIDAAAVCIAMILLLLLVNLRARSDALYWAGISSFLAGVIGVVPGIFLTITRYFDSFTIKQPQVFTSFTGLMYDAVKSFIICETVFIAVGIVATVVYMIIRGRKNDEINSSRPEMAE